MFEPTNEQGVIVLFAQSITGQAIEIIEIQTEFPDAVISINQIEYLVEFEFLASNFLAHGHDIRECDLIICWQNDLNNDFPLSIVELSTFGWLDKCFDIKTPPKIQKELFYWKNRALRAEARIIKLGKDTGNMSDQQKAILDALGQNSETNMTQLAEQLGIGRSTLYRRVDELKAEGKIKVNGAGYVAVNGNGNE